MVTHEQIEEARAGRLISDIPVHDTYHDLVRDYRLEQAQTIPGQSEKKIHPLVEKANQRAGAFDDAEKEARRITEEAEKEDDSEEFEDEDKVDDDDLDDDDDDDEESKQDEAPKMTHGVQSTGMGHLDDDTLRALATAGDIKAQIELTHRNHQSAR